MSCPKGRHCRSCMPPAKTAQANGICTPVPCFCSHCHCRPVQWCANVPSSPSSPIFKTVSRPMWLASYLHAFLTGGEPLPPGGVCRTAKRSMPAPTPPSRLSSAIRMLCAPVRDPSRTPRLPPIATHSPRDRAARYDWRRTVRSSHAALSPARHSVVRTAIPSAKAFEHEAAGPPPRGTPKR